MPCRSDEEGPSAPPPPKFSTPTKPNRDDGSSHGGPDAENSDAESDADVKEEFKEFTGKKRKYNGYLKFTAVKNWVTREEAILEDAEIDHQKYT